MSVDPLFAAFMERMGISMTEYFGLEEKYQDMVNKAFIDYHTYCAPRKKKYG
jgi:hypothetical protein